MSLLVTIALRVLPFLLVIGGAFAWLKVHDHKIVIANDAQWSAKIAAEKKVYEEKIAQLETKQAQVVTRTVIEYRDRVKVVKEKGDEIVREIPVLVPMDSPLLAGGVRVAVDSAATGHLPDDPAGAAGAAAPVTTAALVTSVAENYGTCREEFVKLEKLQSLVTQLAEVKP